MKQSCTNIYTILVQDFVPKLNDLLAKLNDHVSNLKILVQDRLNDRIGFDIQSCGENRRRKKKKEMMLKIRDDKEWRNSEREDKEIANKKTGKYEEGKLIIRIRCTYIQREIQIEREQKKKKKKKRQFCFWKELKVGVLIFRDGNGWLLTIIRYIFFVIEPN